MISIFTPTYNRVQLLERVYKSLVNQSYKNFEWIVVDDGSSDETEKKVKSWIDEQKITIQFEKQKNGGKHRAINKGLNKAKGELFFILDSDDYLIDDALLIINKKYTQAKEKHTISGVAARRVYSNGKTVGSGDFDELVTNSLDIRYKHHVEGDLVEVYELDVIKKYRYPEFTNEKFCPEALIWNRLALHNNLLFFNKGVYVTEYIEGGLTANIVKIRMLSPKTSMLCYAELEKYNIPIIQKVKANSNFWRFSFNDSSSFIDKVKQVNLIFSTIGFPLGFLMYIKDKKQLKA